ncbi:cytochrome P450 [Nocardia sp. 348MFTsu5.1]|uniref:cytochrome P450 n=1 Tax=Nocardia sp. 348MFTsu5.1 TaxID=1172185 RepID=UPI0003697B62|nr:cytochrome P450 [Nocardia sp. 348MFTsu5.1]
MVESVIPEDVATLPLPPQNPLPYRRRYKATRRLHVGSETLRNAGGPVTRYRLAPSWLLPEIVVATSPQGMHDILDRPHTFVEKKLPFYSEQRALIGSNLFNLEHDEWLPHRRATQAVFTKNRVNKFADDMAAAAVTAVDAYGAGETTDLDAMCHSLTLRALGRSVFGLDLDEHIAELAESLTIAMGYVTRRSTLPFKAPVWLPTPARQKARAAAARLHTLAGTILRECRDDPERDAPLVRALIDARDPATGKPLSDIQIRNEMIIFMFAGHDTTSTTLTYSLWALGHHTDIQDRVAGEVAAFGGRTLTPSDVPNLSYTVQVLHEALRLCPPAAMLSRQTVTDIDVDGYRVEAGTAAVVGIYAMHRDPTLWDNPLEFDPDRFSPENFAELDRWQYLPFGGGARGCIGSHFAMLEATLALATIIGRRRIESLDSNFPVALPFTLVPKGPIQARIEVRT